MAYIGVSPSNGVRKKHTYTATASQTSFSGAGDEGITLAYRDSNYVDVYQNGVKLADDDYTATSGTAIVLAQGASADDIVEIIAFDVFSVADTVSKADGGTFDGNVTMAGTLGVTGAITGTLATAAQPNITSVGTLTGFTSTGIDDNATSTAITIDSSENVGIGVVPNSSWNSSWTALQLGATGFVGQFQSGATDVTALGSNVWSDGSYKYIETDEAAMIKLQNGTMIFDVAASGSANAAISFTTAMTIANTGRVGIGTASPASKLHIKVSNNEYTGGIQIEDTDSTTKSAITHVDNNLFISSNATNDHIVINPTGAVTKPLQPAFLASNVGLSTQANISADADNDINFGTEVFDQNADFASNVFTAPVTGRYQLSSVLYTENLDTAANYYIMTIVTSNRSIYNIIDPGVLASDPVYWTFTSSVLADMDAGDTAKVTLTQVAGTSQTDINTHSFFSGYLVA